MVRHDAQRRKLEAKLIESLLYRIQKDFSALPTVQPELAIIAPSSDVVAVSFKIGCAFGGA